MAQGKPWFLLCLFVGCAAFLKADSSAQMPADVKMTRAIEMANCVKSDEMKVKSEADELLSKAEEMRLIGGRESLLSSLDLYSRSLALFERICDPFSQATVNVNTGLALMALGEYLKAHSHFIEAAQLSERSLDPASDVNAGRAWVASGEADRRMGKYKEAMAHLKRGIDYLDKTSDYDGQSAANHNLALVYDLLGRYQEALRHFDCALRIAERHALHLSRAYTLTSIGDIYSSLGKTQRALNYYGRSAEAIKAIENGSEIELNYLHANVLHSIAETYLKAENPETALGYFERSMKYRRAIGDPNYEALTYMSMGKVFYRMGAASGSDTAFGRRELLKAAERFEAGIEILEKTKNWTGVAKFMNSLSLTHQELKNYEIALFFARRALELSQEIGDPRIQGTALYRLGHLELQRGNFDGSLHYLRSAIHIAENMRGRLVEHDLKASYVDTVHDYYYLYIDVLMELHDKQRDRGYGALAFEASERARARTFLDQLGDPKQQARIYSGTDSHVFYQVRSLENDLRRLRASSAGESANHASIAAEISQKKVEYESARSRLFFNKEKFLAKNSTILGLSQVQDLLGSDTTLVSYFSTSEKLFAFTVQENRFMAHRLKADKGDVLRAINCFRDSLLAELSARCSEDLYDWLVRPIRREWLGSKLIIVPHRLLHYLPIVALVGGRVDIADGSQVISHLPSASVLSFLGDERENDRRRALVLAFSEPQGLPRLQEADMEALAIANVFSTRPLRGVDATETALRQQSSEVDVLHIGAHARLDNKSPLFSSLILSPGDGDDGFLEVHEIYRLKLRKVELVSLSACDTHLGPYSAGDDIVALNRAFLSAGAQSVLSTLWKVRDDKARLFMESFYRHLASGSSKAEALHKTQLSIREGHPDPGVWAAFVLTGRPD